MALRKNAKIELLKRVPLFQSLAKRELEQVAQIADELDLREGKELTTEGAPGREFFVLLEGTAEVLKGGRKIRTMSDGDFFGEISLIKNTPRTATVRALTPLHVLVVTERSFKRLLRESPEIQLKVLQALAERLEPSTP